MVIAQAEIWWVELGVPFGSESGFRRPVIVVQSDNFNQSRLNTIVCVALTGSQKWSRLPGNVGFSRAATGLEKDSVANGAHILTLDRARFEERVGCLTDRDFNKLLSAIDIVLGRPNRH